MTNPLQIPAMILILTFFPLPAPIAPPSAPAVAIAQETPAPPAEASVLLRDSTQQAVPADQIRWVTIPAGTRIVIRAVDSIDSRTGRVRQTFLASVDADIVINGQNVVPKKSDAYLRVTRASSAGELRGKSELRLQLESIDAGGMSYAVESATVVGATAGSGAGVVIAAITKGEQVRVRSETRLEFLLERPVEVAVAGAPPAAPSVTKPDNRID